MFVVIIGINSAKGTVRQMLPLKWYSKNAWFPYQSMGKQCNRECFKSFNCTFNRT